MAASDIATTVRYNNTLNKTVYVCPAITTLTAPTRSELNAGTRVDGVITKGGIAGFAGTESTIQSDDIRTGITLAVHDGEDWSGGGTITAYLSKSGSDIRSVLPKGSDTFIVIFDSTDTPGLKMDVFSVHIGAAPKTRAGMATEDIACTFNAVPAVDVTVPA